MLASLLLAVAQDGRVPVSPPPSESIVRLFEREIEIADLIEAAASIQGVAIEYSRSDVEGRVSLRPVEPLSPAALLDALHRTLAARGLTSVQMPGSASLSVVKLADAAAFARLEESTRLDTKAGYAKVLIQLSLERAEGAAEGIRLVLSKAGTATVLKDQRSIVVSDLTPHVRQALRLATSLDEDVFGRQIVEVAVTHASPMAIVTLVERITNAKKAVFGDKGKGTLLAHPEGRSVLIVAPSSELDQWRSLVADFDRPQGATTVTYSPRRFGLADTAKLIEDVVHGAIPTDAQEPWRLVVDALSGALVVTATPVRHAEIEKLFERLEAMAQTSRRPIRTFAIRHRNVEEVRELLQGLLASGALSQPAEPSAASEKPAQGVTAPLAVAPPPINIGEQGDEVVLTVDKPTNRLLAIAPARVLEQIEAVLREIDVRAPQVLVQAIVVSLSDSQTRELGVEFDRIGHDGDASVRLSSLFGLGSPDAAGDVLARPGAGGFSGVVLSPGDFSALVRALETLNDGRSLTSPKLLVDNLHPATLHSVVQTPYASTNASTTVATTSFGGSLDAGTQIEVTPQITDGDQLVLDYSVSISSFVGTASNPALPPPRQENRLTGAVTIPDGFTIAVGGLEIESDSRTRSQVPFLGSIPILGALFGSRTAGETRTRFYVFLRAEVMRERGFEDLKRASVAPMAAAGVDDGWPKLEPRVMR